MEHKGFIAPEDIKPEEWVLGASNTPSFPILREDGNWEPKLPIEEIQNKGEYETFNCTGFNTLNPIEILVYNLTGERVNYSDRWLGIIAGTKDPGNDPHKVAEAIRQYGLIPEDMLPWSDDLNSIDEYYSFKGADKEACYRAGREWLAKYEFKHSWVFTPGQPVLEQLNNMRIALRNSPLGIAVFAWASNDKDIYYKNGPENHWTCVYNVEEFMKVFDSYPPFKKNVDQALKYCKRYSVTLKTVDSLTPEQASGFWAQIKKLLEMIGVLQKKIDSIPKTTYEEVKEAIKTSRIEDWANAIRIWEGDVSKVNPGNLKYSPLTASWGGTKGRKALDGGYFALFKDYDTGFKALCNFLELGCKDQLLAFHNARTLEKFMKIYAGNPPETYIKGVAGILKVDKSIEIKTFL